MRGGGGGGKIRSVSNILDLNVFNLLLVFMDDLDLKCLSSFLLVLVGLGLGTDNKREAVHVSMVIISTYRKLLPQIQRPGEEAYHL